MALTDNLVAYWKLDESSGDASDSVGSNTATNSSATYASGKINNGAVFSGSSQYMYVADTANLRYASSNALSVSFWFKVSNTTGVKTLVSKWSNGGSAKQNWIIYMNGSSLVLGANGTGAVASKASLSANTWYHCVATMDTDRGCELYLDNSSPATGDAGPTWLDGTDQLRFGQNTNTNYLNGMLDEVAIWNRVITSSEVASLYNSGSGLQYPFSASSGNIKKINNIAWANVKKVNNIAVANIKKINGIAAK